jgi:uncharacterized membrane protein
MAPLIVLTTATLFFRLLGMFGVHAVNNWRDATHYGLAVLFVFTGSTHFTGMKHDYAAMVPPPFTGQLWVIHVTGLLEIAGAIGLLVPQTRKLAGICLFLLLLALFPANVFAALNGVQFRGAPPTDIWLRGVIQAVLLAAVWWSTVAPLRFPLAGRQRAGSRTPYSIR